ncbi:MAG: hypothetical protein J6X55_05510 [Victivallales bacterium]|nr:hypothetical protein [Victivallales bacterium]
MAVYAAERNWLLTACLANLSKIQEAEAQFDKCERDFPLTKDATPLLVAEERKALWAMFNMYYKAANFEKAEDFLEKLQTGVKGARCFDWLVLRMNVLKGRLKLIMDASAGMTNVQIASGIEDVYNTALRFSFLFPDVCQAVWKERISAFTKEQRSEYCGVHVNVLYVLGQAEAKVGNVNVAMELFEKICQSAEVDDFMRYESGIALGDIATSDIKKSIEAFKLCEGLAGISREQKAVALYKAAQRALMETRRESAAQDVRTAMGEESVTMLKRLCFEYTDTSMGLEASLCLADYYYDNHDYKNALAFYERYFMSDKCDVAKRDFSRLRWGRCWRLLAEAPGEGRPAEDMLQKAFDMLKLLREGDATDSDVRNQAFLESYRVALAMGKNDIGLEMLNQLIDKNQDADAVNEVVWTALYERMLGNYQSQKLDLAVRDGELFLKLRGDRQDMTPWVREFNVLFGDVQAARKQWVAASQFYRRLELLDKADNMDSLMQYAMYEAAFCLFMNNDFTAADDLLKKHFEGKAGLDKRCLYDSAMLQGKCRQALGDFDSARQCYERAQAVYGQADTYKSSMAKCRQGEMLLMAAESELKKPSGADRASAMKQLARSAEIFMNLLEPKDNATADDSPDKDHFFDLYLRAQYELGKCYEAIAQEEGAPQEAKENALWCYRRIGDYFVAKFKAGNRVRSSRFYIKSIERRAQLLLGGNEPPNFDVLDTVARLYEEYARMALPGSLMADKKAKELRAQMK